MPLGWLGSARLWLFWLCNGALVFFTNDVAFDALAERVSGVPTLAPALIWLRATTYAVMLLRPLFGHRGDRATLRAPMILRAMLALGAATLLASFAPLLVERHGASAIAISFGAYALVGMSVASSATNTFALLAERVPPERRVTTVSVAWGAHLIGGLVPPVTMSMFGVEPNGQMLAVLWTVALVALACIAVHGLDVPRPEVAPAPFLHALRTVWAEAHTRAMAAYMFLAMIAYGLQQGVVEAFGPAVFAVTQGRARRLSTTAHTLGIEAGIVGVSILCALPRLAPSLRRLRVIGPLASLGAIGVLSVACFVGPRAPVLASFFGVGLANGVLVVGIAGSMVALATTKPHHTGLRLGLFTAGQSAAFACLFLGAGSLVRFVRHTAPTPAIACTSVLGIEAILYVVVLVIARALRRNPNGALDDVM